MREGGSEERQLAEHDRRVEELRRACRETPGEDAKRAYLEAQAEKHRFEIEVFGRRAGLDPSNPGLRFPLGRALYEEGRIDEAIPELQKAKADASLRGPAAFYLGQCYVKKKVLKLALKELNSVREDPQVRLGVRKDATYLVGRIWEQAKRKDKALRCYEELIAMGDEDEDGTVCVEVS